MRGRVYQLNGLSKQIKIACNSDCTVLITGGTGTGKTSLARKIHENSSRKSEPFVVVNLAALHEGTLESELFGHEKGSFTGAERKREGRLELAREGTIFLDEVGELSLRMQARLLEFLQSRSITPIGSNRVVTLNTRVIAATHKDLHKAIAKGEFREDLYHRLRVVTIHLKPLKEQGEEFGELVHRCLEEISSRTGKAIFKVSPEVADLLESYDWPGNFRELRNLLEYAIQSADQNEIHVQDLPSWFFMEEERKKTPQGTHVFKVAEVPLTLDYHGTLERFQKDYFEYVLGRNGGRVTRTAKQIGINKTTFLRKLRAYGLRPYSKNLI